MTEENPDMQPGQPIEGSPTPLHLVRDLSLEALPSRPELSEEDRTQQVLGAQQMLGWLLQLPQSGWELPNWPANVGPSTPQAREFHQLLTEVISKGQNG